MFEFGDGCLGWENGVDAIVSAYIPACAVPTRYWAHSLLRESYCFSSKHQ
jgi:hypothetical protein